jgi:protein tyrosine/serine phosphatase
VANIFGKRRWLTFVAWTVAVGSVGVVAYKSLRWKKFAVVAPGAVYRSGQLAGWQLESALKTYGLKTVVCLNPDRADAERALCGKHGVEFRYYPMPSDGRGRPEQFAEVLALLRDSSKLPILVHCNAGVARTGASVALFRQLEQGWDFQRAIDELASFERRGRIDPALESHIARLAVELRNRPAPAPIAGQNGKALETIR